MTYTSLWQTIVTTALVGTERQSLTLTLPENQLGELLSRLDSTDPEGCLLGAAAVVSLYQRAGKLPMVVSQDGMLNTFAPPCEPEIQRSCSLRAGEHLALMLHGEHTELLPEWLAVAAGVGKRVPERYLSELLELGNKQKALREAILPVLGKRGYWLAAQNPEWDYVSCEADDAVWQTGTCSARLRVFRELRKKDPVVARERLATTWTQEGSEARIALVEALKIGLSMADEPFLEAALDDRRKEVRRTAANLLARLPESRLCRRMVGWVLPLLRLKREAQRWWLEVTLPESCDKDMSRDGIETVSRYGLGERAGWLLQMVGIVPPRIWCGDVTPRELIQVVQGSEWEGLLLKGWAIAAENHQDAEWAEALLDEAGKFGSYLRGANQLIEGLFGVLPSERWERFVLNLLQSQESLSSQHPAFLWLRHGGRSWSYELSCAVLEGVCRQIEAVEKNMDAWLRDALRGFAGSMMPAVVDEAVVRLSVGGRQKGYWGEAVDEFLAVLQFRFEMIKALRDEGNERERH